MPESCADCCHNPIFLHFSAELLFAFPPHIGLTPKLGRWCLSATTQRFFSRLLDNLSDGGLLCTQWAQVLAVSSRPGTQHAARSMAWRKRLLPCIAVGSYYERTVVLYGASAFSKHSILKRAGALAIASLSTQAVPLQLTTATSLLLLIAPSAVPRVLLLSRATTSFVYHTRHRLLPMLLAAVALLLLLGWYAGYESPETREGQRAVVLRYLGLIAREMSVVMMAKTAPANNPRYQWPHASLFATSQACRRKSIRGTTAKSSLAGRY